MAYNIPFIDNNGIRENLNSIEFNNLYRNGLRGNLQFAQDPIENFDTGNRDSTLLLTGGTLENQDVLFENNDDISEEATKTDAQVIQRLRNISSVNRPLTHEEKQFELFTTNNFDPRFRRLLQQEALRTGSNIFSEFSEDHVNSVRESNMNFLKESNLYDLLPTNISLATKQEDLLTKLREKNIFNLGFEQLVKKAKEEQELQKEQQKFADTFRGKTKETQSQKFERLTKGRPEL